MGYVGDLHTYTNKYQYTDQQIIPFWEVDRHVSRLCLSFFQKRIISRNLLLIPLMSGCLVVQAHNFFHAPWQMGGWGWATLSLSSLCIVNKNVCCEKEWGNQTPAPWCYMPVVIVNIFWYDSHLVTTIQSDLIQILPLKCQDQKTTQISLEKDCFFY